MRTVLFLAAIFIVSLTTPVMAIDGDLNRDGSVDFADFLILATNFGKSGPVESGRDTVFVIREREIIRSEGIDIVGSSTDLYLFFGAINDTLYIVKSGFVDSVLVLEGQRETNISITGSSSDIHIGDIAPPSLVIPNTEGEIVFNSDLTLKNIKWAFTETLPNIDGTITVRGSYSITFVARNSPIPDVSLLFADNAGNIIKEVKPNSQPGSSVSVGASSFAISYTVSGSFAFILPTPSDLGRITDMQIAFR